VGLDGTGAKKPEKRRQSERPARLTTFADLIVAF